MIGNVRDSEDTNRQDLKTQFSKRQRHKYKKLRYGEISIKSR